MGGQTLFKLQEILFLNGGKAVKMPLGKTTHTGMFTFQLKSFHIFLMSPGDTFLQLEKK